MAARQVAQAQISDASPDETFHLETKRLEHAADLTVDALTQNDAQSRRRQEMELLDACALTIEVFGFKESDFIEGVEFGGAGAFMSEARRAHVTLFI